MQALMLAAGMGKRLGKYTENATKCMVPVNGKTLIEYAIESLVQNNIKKSLFCYCFLKIRHIFTILYCFFFLLML